MGEKPRAGGWRTVGDILVTAAELQPDTALLMRGDATVVTAERLLELVRRGAGLLATRGVRRGQFVVVDAAALDWIDVATAYLAVTWLGAAAVLTTSDAMQRHAFSEIGAVAMVSTTDAEPSGVPTVSPAEFGACADHVAMPAAEPNDRLDVVFTSGTTGEPKPVVSTHRQWTRSVRSELMTRGSRRIVAHTGIPVAVSGGLHGVLLNHLARGVTSLPFRSVLELLDVSSRHPVCELHVTPHAARGVARAIAGAEWANQIRVIRIVGGPVPAAVAEELSARFPRARIVSLYALTEGGSALCVKLLKHHDPDSIGRPVSGTEVRVLGADGRELVAGEIGEVAVRVLGAGAPRYLGDEALNATWYRDGWTRTGDMGFRSDTGDIRLVGRSKELIFLQAGRISPEQVEQILSGVVPSTVEFVVAGVRGAGGWDRIAVFLGGSPGQTDLVNAEQRLTEMRGPFRPDIVRIVRQIPRGPFGKPLRRLLIAQLAADAAKHLRHSEGTSP